MIIQELRNGLVVVSGVPVNRTLTSQGVLDATRRVQYIEPEVVAKMPRGIGEESEVIFFPPLPLRDRCRSGE